jgi:hypothetical protein
MIRVYDITGPMQTATECPRCQGSGCIEAEQLTTVTINTEIELTTEEIAALAEQNFLTMHEDYLAAEWAAPFDELIIESVPLSSAMVMLHSGATNLLTLLGDVP